MDDLPEPLTYAVLARSAENVQQLISRGVSPNENNSWASSPLGLACAFGLYDIARLLLRAGAQLQDKDYAGVRGLLEYTLWDVNLTRSLVDSIPPGEKPARCSEAIFGAMQHDYPDEIDVEALRYLLANGVTNLATADTFYRNTLLHYAAFNGFERKCEALISVARERGENITNIRNRDGFTPLSYLVKPDESVFRRRQKNPKYKIYFNLNIVKILLHEGALIDSKDNRGRSVLDLIEMQLEESHPLLRRQLKGIGTFIKEYRELCVKIGDIDRARKLDASIMERWSSFGPIPRGVWSSIREFATGGDRLLDERDFTYTPSYNEHRW